MKKILLLMATMATIFALVSCNSNDTTEVSATPNAIANEATRTPFRVYSPQAAWPLSDSQRQQCIALNDFSLRLFRILQEEGQSTLFSPLSLAYAMTMTGLACDGLPLQQLNTALGLPADDTTTLHDLMASLMLGLPQADTKVSLNLANAFYMNSSRSDVQINPDFQKALLNIYKADCQSLDFAQQSTLDYINQWCSQQTMGFIPKVLDELDSSLISCLLNALYFKADWAMPFFTDLTTEHTFTKEDGSTVSVPMMRQYETEKFPYFEDDLCQALRLPYADGNYGMTLLLPREGKTTGDVLDELTAERLTTLAKEMEYAPVDMLIPRFETHQTVRLIKGMRQMGLSSWFDGDNITCMVQEAGGTPHGVHIAEAFQVGRIKVNEKGTEAAAVTVFMFTDSAIIGEPRNFQADRPFVYLITERDSGAILFVGTYHGEKSPANDPTGIVPIRM